MESNWVVSSLALALGSVYYSITQSNTEPFVTGEDLGNAVNNLYYEIVLRPPAAREYRENVRDLRNGRLTLARLRRRLVASDEYRQLVKTQTASPSSELRGLLQDHELISMLSKVYREERRSVLPKFFALPLKDILVYEDFNLIKVRLVLRNSKFADFKAEVESQEYLTREDLLKLYTSFFDHAKLDQDAKAIAAGKKTGWQTVASKPRAPLHKKPDTCMTGLTGAAQMCTTLDKNSKIQVSGERPYVLLPDQAWSVPQRHPPICLPTERPAQVQPALRRSELPLTPIVN